MTDRDLEAERALVRAAYVRPELTVSLDVRPEDFTDAHSRRLWETLQAMHGDGIEGLDLVTLVERSRLPASEVATVTDSGGVTANAEWYADTVKRLALKRATARVVGVAWDGIRNGQTGEAVIGSLQEGLAAVLAGGGLAQFQGVSQVLHGVIERAEQGWRGTTGRLTSTIERLDAITGGLYPGELVVLGARTSVGKSTLALQIATDLALAGTPCGYISLEMTALSLARRMLAAKARIDSALLRSGKLSTADFSRVSEAAGPLAKMPLWFQDQGSQRLGEIVLTTRLMHTRHSIKLLVVDYLTLIRPAGGKVDRWVHVGECMHTLKELAKRCGIVVLLAAQLNRRAEANGIPNLADLRESGDIEQDADQVWLLHRKRKEDGMLEDDAVLMVAKHREGSTGTVPLRFHGGWTRFEEVPG